MSELIIEHDTEFYGFLTGVDIISAAKVTEMLRNDASCAIYDGDKSRDVVEEIVRRGGQFYTGAEAKPIVPWAMVYTDVCAASFDYLENETKPLNPAFAEQNWVVLNIGQYMYGKYLQAQIADNKLKLEDIK